MYKSPFHTQLSSVKDHYPEQGQRYQEEDKNDCRHAFVKSEHRGSTSSVATLVDETTPLFSTPLLLGENKDPYQQALDHYHFSAMFVKTDTLQEFRAIFKYAWPLLVTFLLGMGMKVVDVWFFGKLGPQVLAATSLGNLFITVCGIALGNGLSTAIDTLVSQAFTGAKHPWTLGIILQRSFVIMFCFSVPISFLWYHGETLLICMGQDPDLASLAQIYLDWAIPVLFPMLVSTVVRRFLQSIGEMHITMYMVLVLFPLNFLTDYLILEKLDLGMQGAALQNACFHTVVLAIYTVFLYFGTDFKKKYWPGWKLKEACTQWGTFLKLGVPGMLSVSTDWAFEVCAMVTGVLGQTSLAAQSIVLSVNTFLLMVPFALSCASAVRLGHHLGANRPQQAKICVLLSVIVGFCFVSLNAIVMFGFRQAIAQHFTKDVQVAEAVVSLLTIGNSVILSGVLNAFGKQYLVATFNITSYYLIGLPFGIWLTFHYGWGLLGVWSGVAMAGVIKTTCEAVCLLYYIDWDNECKIASERIKDQELPL